VALTPPDLKQCQCEITSRLSPFTLGGDLRPKTAQCLNGPVVVVHELISHNADGLLGSMSLCARCMTQFQRQHEGHMQDFRLEFITPDLEIKDEQRDDKAA
jgi:hypothetical protein